MKVSLKPPPDLNGTATTERRKRLGQYFTGLGLGRLLSALAQAEKAKNIIDPMVGTGDLLASCLEVGAHPDALAGIEIDTAAFDTCRARLPEASILLGSAFDPDTLARLPTKTWDLVIANPPYVRYQSFSDKSEEKHALPNATQIRTGLLKIIPLLPSLDAEDKRLFSHLVENYSGLSDLAVPSWILCAGLVKPGGRLALVVPESWLSRDYATIVNYLLFRWFDIEFVVEDEHASWFEEVQVKTTLIIAKRVKRRTGALTRPEDSTYCHISISSAAASPESPIGRIDLPGQGNEKSFATHAFSWLRNASTYSTELAKARPVHLKLGCSNVIASASNQKWFTTMGESPVKRGDGVFIPLLIHEWLTRQCITPTFETFSLQGVEVGQGLRTGANSFFYADGNRDRETVRLTFSGPLAGLTADAPLNIAKPVLRRQSELPVGFAISPEITTGWALDLRLHALREDLIASNPIATTYDEIPAELAKVIRAAERANFGTAAKQQKIWELTAVAPNIKPAAKGTQARYWYMLPRFAPRHQPDIILARVNSTTPKAYLNLERACLIDANFSTMWTQLTTKWSAPGLLAFMNSAWSQAVIECSGAVMGGGALKVEATHLRRFPIPAFTNSQLQQLDELGKRLIAAKTGQADVSIAQIDLVVAKALGSNKSGAEELRKIAQAGQIQRSKHKGRRG